MTRDEKLAELTALWQASKDHSDMISRLRGQDHTLVAQMLARAIQDRIAIRERILQLQKEG
jgi:hypothetical protein